VEVGKGLETSFVHTGVAENGTTGGQQSYLFPPFENRFLEPLCSGIVFSPKGTHCGSYLDDIPIVLI
jgi:hypothetical protein